MNKSLISIIIPVYNTPEEYLLRLFSCFENQTRKDFECIFIDDGSKEETAGILDMFCEEKGYARVLHVKNGGVSRARNFGISEARGDYIAFADADDEISLTFVAEGLQYDADIIYGVCAYQPANEIAQAGDDPQFFTAEQLQDVKEAFLDIKPRKLPYRILGTPCARLFRRSVLTEVSFPENISIYEDQIFNRRALEKASIIAVVPHVWYTYYQNDFSALHKAVYQDFVKKQLDYWDLCSALDRMEESSIQVGLRRNYIHEYGSIVKENRLMGVSGYRGLRIAFRELAEHPVMKDAVKKTSVSDSLLTAKQKLHLLFLKLHAYGMFAFEQMILNGNRKY